MIGDSDDTPYRRRGMSGADAYVTRLHVRYDAQTFPEDIVFMETKDRGNFQGRYVLRHPFTGPMRCEAGETYWKIKNGIRLTGMPSFKGVLSDDQMWDVALLLKHANEQLPDPVTGMLKGQ